MLQFTTTNPFNTRILLLLTLVAILTVTSSHNYNEAYYKSLGPGYTYGYLQESPTDKFYSTRNLLECSSISLNSQSEFFTYNIASHVCKNYSPKNIMTVVKAEDNNEMAYYRRSEWIKTYAISIGANSLIYNSLLNIGNLSTWHVDKCNGNYCPNFFRHPLLDIWNHLPIDQVKLVLYKNQTAVVTMVFDGRNTTLENWFSVTNLKSSPWDDLGPGETNYFSISGFRDKRRFYVSHNHGGCAVDSGWLSINAAFKSCDWGTFDHFPTICYSETNLKTKWDADGFGEADSMAIFIQLKHN